MSSKPTSTKPYLIRGLYEWCTDNGYTPYIAVKVQGSVRVPNEYVRNGEIVLNVSFTATSGLHMDNESVSFKGRFGGIARDIYVPISAISAIYASENGQGMAFEVTAETDDVEEKNEQAQTDKPAMSLAATNEEATAATDAKDSQPGRKKPSFTVIK